MHINTFLNTVYIFLGILVGLTCIAGTIWGAIVYIKARRFGRQQIILTASVALIFVLIISSITVLFVYPWAKQIIQSNIREYTPTSTLAPATTALPTLTPKSTVTPTSGNIYYVSKNGNNGDGLSWQTAWNELNQINWSRIQPGDKIFLDGGSSQMVYTTTLTIGKSGIATAPIRIEKATEIGRNGKVAIFGGRSIPLPYCGQTNYAYQTSGHTDKGIVFDGHAWIIVDGMNWDGISIYGHSFYGIDMTHNPSNDIVRNIEIYDNGYASRGGSTWRPDTNGHGVYLNGSNLTFEYMDIHDNSDDEFDTGVAAFYRRVPIAHVEAGLRTHDLARPFPEEGNRRIADALATVHFAPTELARHNLLREGTDASTIYVTGNTVVDALLTVGSLPDDRSGDLLACLPTNRRIVLLTAHRRESFGPGLRDVCYAVCEIADALPDIQFVYPVHLNPNVQEPARAILAGHERISLIPPLDYVSLVHLIRRATLILTDSGGIQEEAPTFGKPVLVLREVTERPEAVQAGCARIVGTDRRVIVSAALELLTDRSAYNRMAHIANPFGDGHASERIVRVLLGWPIVGASRFLSDTFEQVSGERNLLHLGDTDEEQKTRSSKQVENLNWFGGRSQ